MAKKKATKRAKRIPVADPRLLKIDLACGQTAKEGFLAVDKFYGEKRVDLVSGEPWPWADSSADELHCSHFIEHIPMVELSAKDGVWGAKVDALIWFFNEAWRVARPGASFTLVWPALQSVRAFQDPTHRRFIPLQTMLYLSKQWRVLNQIEHYLGATCDWHLVSGSPIVGAQDALKSDLVQQQAFNDHWNFAQDFVATLKANKPGAESVPGTVQSGRHKLPGSARST